MDTARPDRFDVIVAGAGLTGLAAALGLRRALGDGARIAVLDPALGQPPRSAEPGGRAYAVAAGARRFLESVGVWSAVGRQAQPILDMVITDSRLGDPVRPAFLAFAGEAGPGEPFAHMVKEAALTAAARGAAQAAGVCLLSGAVGGLASDEAGVRVETREGARLQAALLVAADGARSSVRSMLNIPVVAWDYPQSAIVATIAHERDHEGRANEHFLPAGPFATLPLHGRRSSIVWTESHEEARRLLALEPQAFLTEAERRFGLALGELALEGRPKAFPLRFMVARRFTGERTALVGDAAHVIHPIAGQGLNLGLKDAQALAEAVGEAARLGLDIGGASVLERYQRARRFDTVAMGAATDILNRLFSNDLLPLRLMRDLGLGLVDRLPFAKRYFIREAAGIRGDRA